MAESIDKKIEKMLQEGIGKQAIWRKLKNDPQQEKVLFYLNNFSIPQYRKKYQVLNLTVSAVLLFFTMKKLIVAFSFPNLDIYLLLSLVVPVINIYVLREVLRFRKIGYQFLFVLSILALFQPENHHFQEAGLLLIQICISGFLYLVLFPKKTIIVAD